MIADIFKKLGLSDPVVLLAPLAGVTDNPFREVCAEMGASMTFVEMLSSAALVHQSRRTFDMMRRSFKVEGVPVGVQITGRNAEEIAEAARIIEEQDFDSLDLNMGCPVPKIVKNGGGSAILKDPTRVFEIVKAVRAVTGKPLSVKVRLGWDQTLINVLEVAAAVEDGGADWLTVHGRTRCDDYSEPVRLDLIAEVKSRRKIPIIGNGNIFSLADANLMIRETGVDGVMVARGSLGNPWIFREFRRKGGDGFYQLTPRDWCDGILRHIELQETEYEEREAQMVGAGIKRRFDGASLGALCMRKHLLWYSKGWPHSKKLRTSVSNVRNLKEAVENISVFSEELEKSGVSGRLPAISEERIEKRFVYNSKS